MSLFQALFGVGQALLALIGYYVADWRYISMILAIPTATGFFIPCILDESARWLISKKRINEADTVLHKIANQNGNRFQGNDHFTIYFNKTFAKNCFPPNHWTVC